MMYNAYICEETRYGFSTVFGNPLRKKYIYNKVFDTEHSAKDALCEEVKKLFDEYDECKEWIVREYMHIETPPFLVDGFYHCYVAQIDELTDEEYKWLYEEED